MDEGSIMSSVCDSLMQQLYGANIWNGFEPAFAEAEIQGWNGNHPSLRRLAAMHSPTRIVIDIGVWKGQSTVTMARSMKEGGIDGAVIAIDTFLGSPEHWSFGQVAFARRFGQPDLYQRFLSNVVGAGVQDYVVPMPQTSATAAQILARLGIRAAVIHVDAAHDYREVMNDLTDYWEILEDGGYLIGDDYHRSWPGVVRAAGEFSARVGRPLSVEGIKFVIQK
jgi:Methyltransferase domain